MLDTDGRDIGHHGKQIEIVSGEFPNEVRRIEIDQANDAVLSLERDSQDTAYLTFHDAEALGGGFLSYLNGKIPEIRAWEAAR